MAKKSKYQCILFEKGDVVKERYPADANYNPAREIEETRLTTVGGLPTQFLAFYDVEDLLNVSNLYEPANETTIAKYADGFKYFNEVTKSKFIRPTKEEPRQKGEVERTLFNQIRIANLHNPNSKENADKP